MPRSSWFGDDSSVGFTPEKTAFVLKTLPLRRELAEIRNRETTRLHYCNYQRSSSTESNSIQLFRTIYSVSRANLFFLPLCCTAGSETRATYVRCTHTLLLHRINDLRSSLFISSLQQAGSLDYKHLPPHRSLSTWGKYPEGISVQTTG